MTNRMFQVIVAGGIALAAPTCGGTVEVASHGATSGGGGTGGFPEETGVASTGGGGFPQEGAVSSSSGFGGFPQEGPAMILDAGLDAPGIFDAGHDAPICYPPQETAFMCPDGSIVDYDAGGL
jgi:hypothetical protein